MSSPSDHSNCYMNPKKGIYIRAAAEEALREDYIGMIFNDVVLRFKDGDTPDKVADRYFEIIHKMR